MTSTASIPLTRENAAPMRYGGLIVIMLMGFLVVTAEFLPNGVLTEMAAALGVTPGQAGQTVTMTALAGLIVAPTIGLIFPRMDRRTLLVWAAAAASLSSILVALSPHLITILIARFFLGASISAFWSMSIAVAARLAGPERIGRAMMFTSAGVSLATVAGVPLGVLLSEAFDWRIAFAVVGTATAVVALAVRVTVPTVPAAAASGVGMLVDSLRRPGVTAGMIGHVLVVLGHFLAYTYIRLALERVPDVGAETIVLLLAVFGVGGLIGNLVIGLLVDRAFRVFAVTAPVIIAAAIALLVMLPGSLPVVVLAVFVWGFFFASWLIIVNTWVGHRMPDRREAGGSLTAVGFQLAIVLAAGFGGLLVDLTGVVTLDIVALALLVIGALLFGWVVRTHEADRMQHS
ncbi:MFS transporter [Microbacterium sp. AG238]|uniref:MFS transporter n=1 Tax=Microbacterium sp. AG238 TaxID=2183994 RepID=UPI000E738DB7|nr:MFS transporter [Microbacterium sp. AG238]RKE64605.1 putative MFS family arabinose efflux permease [Microbacterium sp. AG238]